MPPLPPPEVEDSVRISSGARLYQAPRGDAPAVVLRLAEGESRAAEVAAVEGDWVGLWLGLRDDYPFRCYPLLSDARLEVQVWVHLDELLAVTRELIEVNFDDQSFVILMRGVPIRGIGERGPQGALYEVEVDGARLTLALPEERLGRGFFPVPGIEGDETRAPAPGPRPKIAVGGQVIVGELDVIPLPPLEQRRMAEARGECADMLGWLTGEEGSPPARPKAPVNAAFDRGAHPEDVRLGEGVELRWLDDSPAGVTVGEVEAAGGRFGERLCFDALDGSAETPLVLCAAAADG
jgi:hypothetical protein